MHYPQSNRPFSPSPTTISILAASIFTLGLTLSPPAHATDGVAEINETCAVQTGCFPGDTPGYPVTIDGQGGRSYRLTSDLIVPDENTNGIQVNTSDVGIDLNNFSIIRAGCEGGTMDCTPASGTGVGIDVPSGSLVRGTSIKNGSITGMGSYGVFLGFQSEVTGLRVRWNRLRGINVGTGSTVSGNAAYENGNDGIRVFFGSTVSGNTAYGNGGRGISASLASTVSGNTAYNNGSDGIFANTGSTISGNTAYRNGSDGIQTVEGSTVQHNTVRDNNAYGLKMGDGSAYLGNVVTNNTMGPVTGLTGSVTGSGTSRGGNYCSGTGTGSVFCP